MEAFGTTLDRLLPGMAGSHGTAQSLSLIANSASMALESRLDDGMLAAVQALATAPLPAPEPCDRDHFNQCLRVMLAVLPKRNSDEVSGKLLISAYQKKLGGFPKDQISYLADQATTTCEWFPSIAECISIMGKWEREDDAVRIRREAIGAVRREMHARFDEAMARLSRGGCDQAEIDTLPTNWKEIAETRGYLWRNGDGTYSPREDRRAVA
ncbi:hypothetical protein WBP07_18040 [Novosphingobium sp. BL-8A]|uniref:hypothetical protein n=1 Tax=Novosphingobium sp. BL-8A TaxID=3127639 RepID=UPI003757E550